MKRNLTLKLAITAMFAALLVGLKQALALLPNVEVVTLLVAVCAWVWGPAVVFPAVAVFIAVDVALWGINTWVVSYIIHWNIVALSFWLLSKLSFKRKVLSVVLATAAAVLLTVGFGVLTTTVDTLIGFTGAGFFWDFDQFGKRFAAMYIAGLPFFGIHIACNAVLFATAFWPLAKLNLRAKVRLFDASFTQPAPDEPQP